MEKRLAKLNVWLAFGIALVVLLSGLCVAALVVAANARDSVQNAQGVVLHVMSGQLVAQTRIQTLGAGGAPLVMTLPGDLHAFVGREYRIYSSTGQPHRIEIDTNSPQATWDGVNTIVTLGGAIGDGLSFHVHSPSQIVVTSIKNCIFS